MLITENRTNYSKSQQTTEAEVGTLMVFTSEISISKITKDKFSSEVYEDKAGRIFFCSAIAYARSLMLVLMLILMLMSHASVDFFVLSFLFYFFALVF